MRLRRDGRLRLILPSERGECMRDNGLEEESKQRYTSEESLAIFLFWPKGKSFVYLAIYLTGSGFKGQSLQRAGMKAVILEPGHCPPVHDLANADAFCAETCVHDLMIVL